MTMRFDITKETPKHYEALLALNKVISTSSVDQRLIHLVKIRASQINGCAFCVGMHVNEAIEDGIAENLLHLVPVWRETNMFNSREKAALAWAERLTLVAGAGVSEEEYEATCTEFSKQEIAELTVAISVINLWNRISVSAKMPA